MKTARIVSLLSPMLLVAVCASEDATITGTVTWEGEAPKPYMMDITSKPDDLKVCQHAADAQAKASPRLAVDPESKGVRYTVVVLEGVPPGKSKDFPQRDVILDQKGCEFHPHVIWAEVDSEITIHNSDNTLHNVHAKGEDGDLFNLAMPTKDQVIKKKLKDEGIFDVVCDAGHPWMSAVIFVMEHPYIAITDEKGAFAIDGVPAGTYKLKFWHEGWEATPVPGLNTNKAARYTYADPVDKEVDVVVKAGESKAVNAVLGADGFK